MQFTFEEINKKTYLSFHNMGVSKKKVTNNLSFKKLKITSL